jgi:hypothetical protein
VRQARAEEEVKVFNGVVRALNALSCGFAGGGPKPNGLGTNIALQEAVAKQLESKVKDFAQGQPCRRSLLSNCGVCTSVVCMCGAYYSLDFLERGLFAAGLSGSLAAVDEAKAVPLVAERLSLPARGAVVRLVDVLPGKLAVLLAGGRDMVRPREEWPPQPRPSLIVQGYEEWAAVVRRLSAAGMIVFLDRVERINGAFAVPKPDGGLRFIFNGTAANEVFFEPPRVDLPTPSHVAELEVPGGAAVFVAKTDLSDFFHSFRVEPWLLPFFAMVTWARWAAKSIRWCFPASLRCRWDGIGLCSARRRRTGLCCTVVRPRASRTSSARRTRSSTGHGTACTWTTSCSW